MATILQVSVYYLDSTQAGNTFGAKSAGAGNYAIASGEQGAVGHLVVYDDGLSEFTPDFTNYTGWIDADQTTADGVIASGEADIRDTFELNSALLDGSAPVYLSNGTSLGLQSQQAYAVTFNSAAEEFTFTPVVLNDTVTPAVYELGAGTAVTQSMSTVSSQGVVPWKLEAGVQDFGLVGLTLQDVGYMDGDGGFDVSLNVYHLVTADLPNSDFPEDDYVVMSTGTGFALQGVELVGTVWESVGIPIPIDALDDSAATAYWDGTNPGSVGTYSPSVDFDVRFNLGKTGLDITGLTSTDDVWVILKTATNTYEFRGTGSQAGGLTWNELKDKDNATAGFDPTSLSDGATAGVMVFIDKDGDGARDVSDATELQITKGLMFTTANDPSSYTMSTDAAGFDFTSHTDSGVTNPPDGGGGGPVTPPAVALTFDSTSGEVTATGLAQGQTVSFLRVSTTDGYSVVELTGDASGAGTSSTTGSLVSGDILFALDGAGDAQGFLLDDTATGTNGVVSYQAGSHFWDVVKPGPDVIEQGVREQSTFTENVPGEFIDSYFVDDTGVIVPDFELTAGTTYTRVDELRIWDSGINDHVSEYRVTEGIQVLNTVSYDIYSTGPSGRVRGDGDDPRYEGEVLPGNGQVWVEVVTGEYNSSTSGYDDLYSSISVFINGEDVTDSLSSWDYGSGYVEFLIPDIAAYGAEGDEVNIAVQGVFLDGTAADTSGGGTFVIDKTGAYISAAEEISVEEAVELGMYFSESWETMYTPGVDAFFYLVETSEPVYDFDGHYIDYYRVDDQTFVVQRSITSDPRDQLLDSLNSWPSPVSITLDGTTTVTSAAVLGDANTYPEGLYFFSESSYQRSYVDADTTTPWTATEFTFTISGHGGDPAALVAKEFLHVPNWSGFNLAVIDGSLKVNEFTEFWEFKVAGAAISGADSWGSMPKEGFIGIPSYYDEALEQTVPNANQLVYAIFADPALAGSTGALLPVDYAFNPADPGWSTEAIWDPVAREVTGHWGEKAVVINDTSNQDVVYTPSSGVLGWDVLNLESLDDVGAQAGTVWLNANYQTVNYFLDGAPIGTWEFTEFDAYRIAGQENQVWLTDQQSELLAVTGGAGNTLRGGDGDGTTPETDVLAYGATSTGIQVDLSNVGTDGYVTVTRGTETDKIQGFEGILGSQGNDTITGDDGANILRGGGGTDTLIGGGGGDVLIAAGERVHSDTDTGDTLRGGAGLDILIDVHDTTATLIGRDAFSAVEDEKDNDVFIVSGTGTSIQNFAMSTTGAHLSGRASNANDKILFAFDAAAMVAAALGVTVAEVTGAEFTFGDDEQLAVYEYMQSMTVSASTPEAGVSDIVLEVKSGATVMAKTTLSGSGARLVSGDEFAGTEMAGTEGSVQVIRLDKFPETTFDPQTAMDPSIDTTALMRVISEGIGEGQLLFIPVALEAVLKGTIGDASPGDVMAANILEAFNHQFIGGYGDQHMIAGKSDDSYQMLLQDFTQDYGVQGDAGRDRVFDIGGNDEVLISNAGINDLHLEAVAVGREVANTSLRIEYTHKEAGAANDGTDLVNTGEVIWQGHYYRGGELALETITLGSGAGEVSYAVSQGVYTSDGFSIVADAADGDKHIVVGTQGHADNIVLKGSPNDGFEVHMWGVDTPDNGALVDVIDASEMIEGLVTAGRIGSSTLTVDELREYTADALSDNPVRDWDTWFKTNFEDTGNITRTFDAATGVGTLTLTENTDVQVDTTAVIGHVYFHDFTQEQMDDLPILMASLA